MQTFKNQTGENYLFIGMSRTISQRATTIRNQSSLFT